MKKLRLLLVDDEEELICTLADRLKFRGFKADAVLNCRDAIKKAEKKQYDVVVIDIKMPGISGIELMKILLHMQPNLKVILITGHCSIEESEEAITNGAFDCLLKPVKIDHLIEKIKTSVGIVE
ncbi:response regulator [Bacteroidota bacterium]